MLDQPNVITSENHTSMWCRHVRLADGFTGPANRLRSDGLGCLGEKCPGLVKTMVESDQWCGYCGPDHPHYIPK